MSKESRGFVSLVGAGPGDPGLLTLAGRDRLTRADVVVYDRLANPVLLDYAPASAERIFAGKSPERKALTQEQINETLIEKALEGHRVVRLKGGDPFVFGRGGEEALALLEVNIAYEVVPGVTSAVAAPAYAGVPVTHRGIASSFAVVTGHEDDEKDESSVDWRRLATAVDTIVVLMGGAALASVSQALIDGGKSASTPAVSIEWGTTTSQRSVAARLEDISVAVEESGLKTPLLTVVGEVGNLRDRLAWFEDRPLFGKRVLVTRTRDQASVLSERLRNSGAVPVELSTMELVPVADDAELETMVQRLAAGKYDWCLFTSTNAVDAIVSYLDRSERDVRVFAGCKLAALGSATADALRGRGLRPESLAREFSSKGLLEALTAAGLKSAKVLLPRASGASQEFKAGLEQLGAEIDEVILYEPRPPVSPNLEAIGMLRAGEIDAATFASSSSIRNLAKALNDDFSSLEGVTVACIGPITAETAREHDLTVEIEPEEHTIAALVEGLEAHFGRQK